MLLDEIIDLAIDDKHALAMLLRQCLMLAHELKNDRLKSWVNQELNGYDSPKGLPEYRTLQAPALGNFSGYGGASIKNWVIPPAVLEKRHRPFATLVHLTQPIGALEDAMRADGGLGFRWPGDLVLYYQNKIENTQGMALVEARQMLSKSHIAAVLDVIRNRTLSMALELRDEVGQAQDLKTITPTESAKLAQTINNYISGGTNIFASGQSQVNASITQTAIQVGDRTQLEEILKSVGLSDEAINQLAEAERADGEKKMGTRVMEWVKKNASKAMVGTVKLGTDITKEIIVAYLKQYHGLN